MHIYTQLSKPVRASALALALAALATPVAQGGTNDGNARLVSAAERPNVNLRNDIAHSQNGARSSARQSAPSAPIVVSVDGGFDWASAGVGAAGGFGLVVGLGGAASVIRARRRATGALS
jgi:hypothetical protein